MSSLLIRKFSPELKARLRQRAAKHQRSLEAEARAILAEALMNADVAEPHFAEVMTQLFGVEHGVELTIPRRTEARPLPELQ